MTETPIVPSPTGPSQPASVTNTPPPPTTHEDTGVIRCICGSIEDDGNTVACDKCDTWQHMACMGVTKEQVDVQSWFCPDCSPRPVDARKAKDKQRRRPDEHDQGPKSASKPKKTSKSHKKKESSNGIPNGTSKTTQGTEKMTSGKLPSPKEGQPPSRKRQRVAQAHLQPPAGNGPPGCTTPGVAVATPSPGATYFSDRNGDLESDSDFDRYRSEFTDIWGTKDRFVPREVERYLRERLAKLANDDEQCKRYSSSDFESISFPKSSVKLVPDSSTWSLEYSRWSFVLEQPCPKGKPITLFKGVIGFLEDYTKDPISQYAIWKHPKPYVVFCRNFSIFIDARINGSEARFIRRSCRPNATLSAVLVDNSQVCFGLFPVEPLKAGSEITIGWDWEVFPPTAKLAENGFDWQQLASDELKLAAGWVEGLTGRVGECACQAGVDCMFTKIKKWAGVDLPKAPVTNGTGRKPRVKRNPSMDARASKEATPEISVTNPADEDDRNSRAGSVGSRGKPRSRDLTPMDVGENAEISLREQRKIQETVKRIDQAGGQQAQPPKRRKRSTISEGSKADGTKRYKSSSTQKDSSPISTNPDSGRDDSGKARRRSSNSSTSSEDRKPKHTPLSPSSSSGRSKTVNSERSAAYVDAGTQTMDESGLPWWKQSVHPAPSPRPPRVPLRKRLMQTLIREREEAATSQATGDKKRKHDAIAEVSTDSSKALKTSDGESARLSSPVPAETAEASDDKSNAKRQGLLPEEPNANIQSHARSRGPALSDLFADPDRPRELAKAPSVPAVAAKPPPTASPTPQVVNGQRSNGLHLQVPVSGVLSPPISASSQSPGSPQHQLQSTSKSSIPGLSPSTAATVNSSAVAPSPTRTKKLSLGDYSRRKNRAPSVVDDKAAAAAAAQANLSASNTVKPVDAIATNGLSSVLDGQKLAEILTPRIVEPQSTHQLPSTHAVATQLSGTPRIIADMESKKIPTAPKQHQQWGVR